MADSKISALPTATTPLAGTEVLPIVQSGVTDKISVENLTAGRLVNALSFGSANNTTSANTISSVLYLRNKGGTTPADSSAAAVAAVSGSPNWYSYTNLDFYINLGPDVTSAASTKAMRLSSTGIAVTGAIGLGNKTSSANTICSAVYLGNLGSVLGDPSSADAAAAAIVAVSGSTNWYSGTSLAFYTNPGPDVTTANAVERARIDKDGSFLVGVTSGSTHQIKKPVSVGVTPILILTGASGDSFGFYNCDNTGWNATQTGALVGKIVASGRSINAAGTINASGADYAEYEHNNGLIIAKGSVVGFKADGTLTLTYSEAVRFGIKSTNPSYVGGDTWGGEEQVGKRPEQPVRIADVTEQREVSAAVPATDETPAIDAVYETLVITAGDTDAEWAAKQAQYSADLAVFEAALEAARQQVDRIAYSGKVPCNVLGATPGGYIIAADNAGSIAGEFVVDPDFAQYKKAVGRVNRILEDGRCEIAVMVH